MYSLQLVISNVLTTRIVAIPPRGQAKTTTAAIKWFAGVLADYINNKKYINFFVAPWPFVL